MTRESEDESNHSDGEYDENADEDFNPTAALDGEDVSSSSEDEATSHTSKLRKRKAETFSEELDSGDEATIQERQGRKKKRKTDSKLDEQDGPDSGGEGSFVRTRAQREREKVERKERKRGARQGQITVDIESLWKDLSAMPVGRAAELPIPPLNSPDEHPGSDAANQGSEDVANNDSLIWIRRRIEFAGEITEVEERIPRSSQEAQAYLAEHPEADTQSHANGKKKAKNGLDLERPLRRPSMFEPNPTGFVKGVDPTKLRLRTPSRLDVLMAEKRSEAEAKRKAERMTTMGKSALDWKAFVQEEGLGEEMEKYKKSKGGYLEREDFLGRAQMAQEIRGREARLKG